MKSIYHLVLTLAAVAFFAACESGPKKPTDTPGSGTVDISVDETYQPIIEQELRVFDSSFPEAHIRAHYKPEAECVKDFLEGRARLILVTRELLPDEKTICEQKKIVPTSLPLAKDAIAVVLNNESPDSNLSVSQIRGILTGTYPHKYTVVFDNQGSSTVRYMTDSIIPGLNLAPNVYGAKGNDSVISYVAKNPDAIGFVGVSYVGDDSDPAGLAFISNVKVVKLFNDSLQTFYHPYQAYIAQGYYPLTRKLFYINRETYPGLGTGFANFLSKERGQLIFKQARLFPLRSSVIFREASVNP
jgi:phosphate transport system substrate-binding protein